mgnify:CR=1 FL=1
MKNFSENVLFLDRSDINTDEIIPAKYLTEITKEALGPHLLEDLCLEGFIPGRSTRDKQIVVSRANFGCGSSREHAPWAFEVNGIHVVIAESFARIFRQNMFNGGMLAVELPADTIADLFTRFATGNNKVKNRSCVCAAIGDGSGCSSKSGCCGADGDGGGTVRTARTAGACAGDSATDG